MSNINIDERRLSPRFSDVPFEFFHKNNGSVTIIAEDASAHAARFRKSDKSDIKRAQSGSFRIGGELMDINSDQLWFMDDLSRDKWIVVGYKAEPSFDLTLSAHEQSFLALEMSHMWDRYKQIQEKNKYITNTVFRLYMFLFVFAAAPFTLQRFTSTGISRVWGFGGVWLAIAIWFFCDRSYRAYGVHWFEKIFCLRQIDQIRKMIVGLSERYNRHSLFRTIPRRFRMREGKHIHISRSQVLYTIYFYKVVSLFQPFYLILFISLILYPNEMADPNTRNTSSLFFRVALGFSFIFFIWLITSMNRCFGILKNTFRARRISTNVPWPKFPTEDEIRLPHARTFRIAYSVLLFFAIFVSAGNLILFSYRLFKGQGFEQWWEMPDIGSLIVTPLIFFSLYVHDELYVRHFMKTAKRERPLPND